MAASATRDAFPAKINRIELEPAGGSDKAMTLVMSADDNSEWVSSILRAASFAIIAFQIGYTLLDAGEYPQTFARTLPLHIASMTLGLVAIMATLSPRALRNWRAIVRSEEHAAGRRGISADLRANSAPSYRKHDAGPGCDHGNAVPACVAELARDRAGNLYVAYGDHRVDWSDQ